MCANARQQEIRRYIGFDTFVVRWDLSLFDGLITAFKVISHIDASFHGFMRFLSPAF